MKASLELRYQRLNLVLAKGEYLLDEDNSKLIALGFIWREWINGFVADDSAERRLFLRQLAGEIEGDYPLEVIFMGHTVRHDDIKEQDISRTWSASSHFPELTARQYLVDRIHHFAGVAAQLTELATTPEKSELLANEWQGYTKRDDEYFKAWLAATSRTASSFITGPSKFPVARNAKRLATAERRAAEWREFRTRRMARIRRALHRLDKATTTPLEEARERLQQRQQVQEEYKAINKAARGPQPEAALQALGYSAERIAKLLNPEYGRPGVPEYLLSNNRAEIRRLTNRIEQLEKAQELAQQGTESETYGEVVLHQAHDIQRVQLHLPERPTPEQKTLLKKSGFRYAPTLGVWQRQLTSNGLHAAREVAKRLGEL